MSVHAPIAANYSSCAFTYEALLSNSSQSPQGDKKLSDAYYIYAIYNLIRFIEMTTTAQACVSVNNCVFRKNIWFCNLHSGRKEPKKTGSHFLTGFVFREASIGKDLLEIEYNNNNNIIFYTIWRTMFKKWVFGTLESPFSCRGRVLVCHVAPLLCYILSFMYANGYVFVSNIRITFANKLYCCYMNVQKKDKPTHSSLEIVFHSIILLCI